MTLIKSNEKMKSNLNNKYTFDNFVIDEMNNKVAYEFALNVAQDPSKIYNPLFIYGENNAGKTHLLHAIGNYIIDNSDLKVLYISSEQFIYGFENSKKEDNSIFSNKFNDIDVLLFDDINYLSSNYEIQKEFFHIFNSLYANSKQIVLTSNIAPKDLESFEERLKVRFFLGLIIKINPLNRNQL